MKELLDEKPRSGCKISVNQKAVYAFISGQYCWWVIVSICEKDASKALLSYGQRNEVEVVFDDFKNSLSGDRTKCHSDSTLFGRFFILFISVRLEVNLRMLMMK